MRMRQAGAVALGCGDSRGEVLVLLDHELVLDGDSCAQAIRPVAIALCPCPPPLRQSNPEAARPEQAACGTTPYGPAFSLPGQAVSWRPLAAQSIRLDVNPDFRRLQARFSREFKLPAVLRGLGLGTYILSTLVGRAVALGFGGARVRSLHLLKRQDTPLRNAFYVRMGFDLVLYADGSGWARAKRLDQLRAAHDTAKVREAFLEQPASLAHPRKPVYTRSSRHGRKGDEAWK